MIHTLPFEPKKTIHTNLSVDELIKKGVERGELRLTDKGAAVVYTDTYTGRSPKDRFIVDTSGIHNVIGWGNINVPISEAHFNGLYDKIIRYLSGLEEVYCFKGYAGADSESALALQVIGEYAYQALFARHMFRHIADADLSTHKPELTVLVAPSVHADPALDGTNSEAFVILNLEKKVIIIGGTKYSGEIKKSVFSVMNYLLPDRGTFPMHCSANIGADGKCAVFFGLSGTGKTTLSADSHRRLIGDDEHGWNKNGVFNFEGGCYAKCINLTEEKEPQIFRAIRTGTLLENVVLRADGSADYDDGSITENTRAAYPIDFIDNHVESGCGPHPTHIIFLTADAYGVLPPVARLSTEGAMYHFISGYTSKVAGTERGVTEPKAVFSTCFGAPFMPREPAVYADLLKTFILKYNTTVYLVNTGWYGGSYGVGKRFNLSDTRAIATAILSGTLDAAQTVKDSLFNLDVPQSVPGVDLAILTPRMLWSDKESYDNQARKLCVLFQENMKKFSHVSDAIIRSGPFIS